MTPCSLYCQRQTACANRSHTSLRHNRVVCCLCDTDRGSTSCCSTQSLATSDACRLPTVQRCKRLVEVPRACAKQDNFKQEQLLVAQERKRIQQQKDRDSYYKERHERLHAPKLYKNDLKQVERDVRTGKYKSQQNKSGAQQNNLGTQQTRRGAQPDIIHHRTTLSKEEQYAEDLRLARISFSQQRKKCAANNPIRTFARIPSIPTAPPTGSCNVTIETIDVMNPGGRPDTKFFTGDVQRNVHEVFQKKEEELRKESLEFEIVQGGNLIHVSPPESRSKSPAATNSESPLSHQISTQVIDMTPPTNEDSKPITLRLPSAEPNRPASANSGNKDMVNPSRRDTLKNTSSADLIRVGRIKTRRKIRGDPNNIFMSSITGSNINI